MEIKEMGKVFEAAQECTGEYMPENWEAAGKAHSAGTCKCFRRAIGTLEDFQTTMRTNGIEPTIDALDEALKKLQRLEAASEEFVRVAKQVGVTE